MTKFPHIPALHRCPNRGRQRVYALCGAIEYPDGVFARRGFKTDGASRPWFLRWFLKRFGRGFVVFIRHDRDYALQDCSRSEADKTALFLMLHPDIEEDQRISEKKAIAIYLGLRAFGWASWYLNSKRPLSYFFCPEQDLTNPNIKNDN